MKFYTNDEMLDKYIGVKGTPERESFDADVEAALIGASIKNARKANNLTQAQLGERVGVQPAQISKIESGRNLTISTIVKVFHSKRHSILPHYRGSRYARGNSETNLLIILYLIVNPGGESSGVILCPSDR